MDATEVLEDLDRRMDAQRDRLRTAMDDLNTAHAAFTQEATELYRLRTLRTSLLAGEAGAWTEGYGAA